MRLILSILAVAFFLTTSGDKVYACAGKKSSHITEKTFCLNREHSTRTDQTSGKKCCDLHSHQTKKVKDMACGHSCDQSCCDCNHRTTHFALKVPSAGIVQYSELVELKTIVWFFRERAPKPVYLSLFIPPNINRSF